MTLSFTRAEYWLLEAAVEECLPIAGLSDGQAAGQVNKTDHGVTQAEMIEALDRLFTDGLIIGEQYQSFWSPCRRKYQLTRAEIETELKRPSYSTDGVSDGYGPLSVYYWLTAQGGAAWEAFARPDWDHFMDGFGSCAEEEDGSKCVQATCPSKFLLERYLAGAHWLGFEIDPDAAVWDTIRPWEATYWKELPLAHHVQCPIIRYTESVWRNMPHEYQRLNRWYRWRS